MSELEGNECSSMEAPHFTERGNHAPEKRHCPAVQLTITVIAVIHPDTSLPPAFTESRLYRGKLSHSQVNELSKEKSLVTGRRKASPALQIPSLCFFDLH